MKCMTRMHLGKTAARYDHRDLLFADFVTASKLPPLPSTFGDENLISATGWGMLGNDSVGDCVLAGGDHETMLWNKARGKTVSFTAANALSDYSAITGYNPDDPSSDQGTDVRTALNYRKKTGLIDSAGHRHKIDGYMALEPGNLSHVKEGAYLFEAVGIGIEFPASAMTQFNKGQPWSVVSGAKIEGGHYIPIVGFDGTYLYIVTWGKLQKMTVQFFTKYCDEAYALFSLEMLNSSKKSREGFDETALLAALKQV
jgi:hypothetical protein